jgi:uncharacterized protein with FMN-binding domain
MSKKNQPVRKFDLAFMLRKYVISAFVLFTFVAYAIHDRLTNADTTSTLLSAAKDTTGTQLVRSSVPANQVSNANDPLSTAKPIPASVTPIPPTAVPASPTAIPIIPTSASVQSIFVSPPTLLPVPTLAPTPIPPPQVMAVRGANIRGGDSTTYDVIGGLQASETATIIGISNRDSGWYLIQTDYGLQGWVSASVVNVSGDLTGVPLVQPPPLPSATPVPVVPTPMGLYSNGQFTGDSVDAFYGMVQVSVSIQNGEIANVQFLDYPHDRRTSQRINSIAMPYLVSEAIQAQSAYINIISGATLTSEAFAQSLQSALIKAKAGV